MPQAVPESREPKANYDLLVAERLAHSIENVQETAASLHRVMCASMHLMHLTLGVVLTELALSLGFDSGDRHSDLAHVFAWFAFLPLGLYPGQYFGVRGRIAGVILAFVLASRRQLTRNPAFVVRTRPLELRLFRRQALDGRCRRRKSHPAAVCSHCADS